MGTRHWLDQRVGKEMRQERVLSSGRDGNTGWDQKLKNGFCRRNQTHGEILPSLTRAHRPRQAPTRAALLSSCRDIRLRKSPQDQGLPY